MVLWVGTSWKMNKTLPDALAFTRVIAQTARSAGVQRFVMPPFTVLREVCEALASTDVKVGAQTMHWAPDGAWTGEISAAMVADCGARMVELGHSERRAHFGETDESVGRKVHAAVSHGLTPLICVGEDAAARDAGRADDALERQVRLALARLVAAPLADRARNALLIAYEPIWAIGDAGEAADAAYAAARHATIKAVAHDHLGWAVPCLYGGSVTAQNCTHYCRQDAIDGVFVGRAAWNADGFVEIVRTVERIGAGPRAPAAPREAPR